MLPSSDLLFLNTPVEFQKFHFRACQELVVRAHREELEKAEAPTPPGRVSSVGTVDSAAPRIVGGRTEGHTKWRTLFHQLSRPRKRKGRQESPGDSHEDEGAVSAPLGLLPKPYSLRSSKEPPHWSHPACAHSLCPSGRTPERGQKSPEQRLWASTSRAGTGARQTA